MCKPRPRRRSTRLLLTHESFVYEDVDKDDAGKRGGNPYIVGLNGPSLASTLLTVAFYTSVLFLIEWGANHFLTRHSHLSEVLQSETNRKIISRHTAVDFPALAFCVYIAFANRNINKEIIEHGLSWGKSGSMKNEDADIHNRVFKYHPGAHRLLLLFFVFQVCYSVAALYSYMLLTNLSALQVKNMWDTIKWNDGIAFILHHIFAGAAAWGGMYPGCCHHYALFYFGFSEISTAILCLLANFDEHFGVKGLDLALPMTKIVIGGAFVVSFIICRLVMWPFVTYHYVQDTLTALKSNHRLLEGRKTYLKAILVCCCGLSLIQFVFVHMIIETGKTELKKLLG